MSATDVLFEHFTSRYGDRFLQPQYKEDDWTIENEVLNPVEVEAWRLIKENPTRRRVHLTDALDAYLANHEKAGRASFEADTRRAIAHVTSVIGDLPLDKYLREHVNKVRDYLLERGNKTATVRRRLNVVNAVINRGLVELDLQGIPNPFNKVIIPRERLDAVQRQSFTNAELSIIRTACRQVDDDIRHIVALQVDTGARLGEIVGLRVEDVVLADSIPHIRIRFHEALGRTLKTKGSERDVPLLGVSRWGAERALDTAQLRGTNRGWLFPRYATNNSIKATQASNAINKWLRRLTRVNISSHSFRHAMQTRLRHAEIPEEIQDAIGGWGKRTISRGYGDPASLRQLRRHLETVVPS
jgi:integrase